MGKFLRDKDGNLVNIQGGLVLQKNLDRKPRDCEQCGFDKWVKKDKIFIIQRNGGFAIPNVTTNASSPFTSNNHTGAGGGMDMEWICPDCALKRGLPPEHYHKNFYATPTPEALRILQNYQLHRTAKPNTNKSKSGGGDAGGGCEAGWSLLDMTGFMCK